eukprot:721761-Rhodomonas_salina.1
MAAAQHQGSNIATSLAFNARWQQPLPASVTFDLTAASSHTLEKTDEGIVLLRNNTALLCDKLETPMGLPCRRLHYPLYRVLKVRGWSRRSNGPRGQGGQGGGKHFQTLPPTFCCPTRTH